MHVLFSLITFKISFNFEIRQYNFYCNGLCLYYESLYFYDLFNLMISKINFNFKLDKKIINVVLK